MKTKSLLCSYWIFQPLLMLSNTIFFFPISKILSLASALPLSSGFNHFLLMGINTLLANILLPLLLRSWLVFHRDQSWSCTGLFVHFFTFRHHSQSCSQLSAFCRRQPASKVSSTKRRIEPYAWIDTMYRRHKMMDVKQPAQSLRE